MPSEPAAFDRPCYGTSKKYPISVGRKKRPDNLSGRFFLAKGWVETAAPWLPPSFELPAAVLFSWKNAHLS